MSYEIVVRGVLSEHFASTFLSESVDTTPGPRVDHEGRTTAILIDVIDQAHLLEIERVNPAHETEGSTR